MTILESHHSPDATLHLLVEQMPDGHTYVMFAGYTWQIRGDLLARDLQLPEEQAIRRCVDDILTDRTILAVEWNGQAIRDVWCTNNPANELNWKPADVVLTFRRWSGREDVIALR